VTLKAALGGIPADISSAIERELAELLSRYARRDWGPSELNGARLAEAVLRYVEWRCRGRFTPLDKQLNRSKICTHALNDTTLDDSIRIHIPSAAVLIMDVRNKRDVAHLSAVVDVNEMDSELVLRLGAWIVSEIVRLEAGLGAKDIQSIVDSLSATHTPAVEVFEGETVVVAPELDAAERVVVALYHRYPGPMELGTLKTAVKYGHITRFRGILQALDKKGLVHLKEERVYLTHRGVVTAEDLLM